MDLRNDELERLLGIATVCIRRIYREGGKILLDTSGRIHEPTIQAVTAPELIIPADWLKAATGEEVIHALARAEWDIRQKWNCRS